MHNKVNQKNIAMFALERKKLVSNVRFFHEKKKFSDQKATTTTRFFFPFYSRLVPEFES